MPLNTTAKGRALKSGTGGGAVGDITYIGVASTATVPGSGTDSAGTEPSGGTPPYTRQVVSWGTPGAEQVTSDVTVVVPVPAGSYGYWTLWSEGSGNSGVYRGFLPFGAAVKGFGSVDTAGAAADTVQSAGHGLVTDDRVLLSAVYTEALPAGLSETTLYWVVAATADTFQVSVTEGGTAVNITGAGELGFQSVTTVTFPGQGELTATAGSLIVDASAL